MVTIRRQPARKTLMPPLVKSLRCVSAASAGLRRAARVNLHKDAPGTFSLVRNLIHEVRPSGIGNRFRKAVIPDHVIHSQIFNSYQPVAVDKPSGNLMVKVRPLLSDVRVRSLEKLDSLTSAVTAPLPSCYFALRSSEFGLCFPVPSRIFYLCPVREGGECEQPNVHADALVIGRKGPRFTLNTETDVPVTSFAPHGQSFNLPFHRSVQFDFNEPDPLQAQLRTNQLAAVTVRGECDAVESGVRLEARVSSFFFPLHSGKESLERLVHAAQNGLARGEISKAQVSVCSNLFKLIGLAVVVDRFTVNAPCVTAFLERGIVEVARLSQLTIQKVNLCARWVKAKLERLSLYIGVGQDSHASNVCLLGKARSAVSAVVRAVPIIA